MADAESKPTLAVVKDNVPVKHTGTMTRVRWRNLFIRVNQTAGGNKAEEARLQAAAEELEEVAAMITKSGGRLAHKPNVELDEMITLEISDRALKGIKLSAVKFLKPDDPQFLPPYLVRKDLFESLEGFGRKFRKMIETETKLADSDELDEDDPLDLSEEKKP